MRELRDGANGGEFHRLVDRACADIERAAENVGKAENVVDLVRIIRAPGADHRVRLHRQRLRRIDFRIGIGERHDQRALGHPRDHVLLQDAGG